MGHTFFVRGGLCHSPSSVKRDGGGNHTQPKKESPDPFDIVDIGLNTGLECFKEDEEYDASRYVAKAHGSKNRKGQDRSRTERRAFSRKRRRHGVI